MRCEVCTSALSEGALFCGECGSSVYTQVVEARSETSDTEVLPRFLDEGDAHPGTVPAASYTPVFATPELVTEPVVELVELVEQPMAEPVVEQPLIDSPVEPEILAPIFVFTLSTGESLAVSANGLLGRMPQPAPGESFAHLIVVTDPSRSVSKTHLEFGFDGEQLWVLDRNSGNGSIIREEGKIPRRAEPGRQYLVSRGTRIDMGQAHLLVS